MIPGPTPVPESVLLAMARHPIGHRSGEFQAIVKRTTEQLQWLHQTKGNVLVLAGSGTAAMEAGIINVLSKGDRENFSAAEIAGFKALTTAIGQYWRKG